MLLPSPLFTMVADTQMTELGRVRETIHNKYDRKFAAYSTLYMGLSFVQTPFLAAKRSSTLALVPESVCLSVRLK